ncbi:lamin tail domain-containing protein, partial [Patescibacteria group bacterium]|nr:lamin tail domain-containing protein [Patescibacteria group bacterium]
MRNKEKILIAATILSAAFFIAPKIVWAQVVINEVAWMGTAASASDEWLELYNNTAQEIVLEGWKLTEGEGTVIIVLKGTIAPGAYYLIERTDDTTVSDIAADLKGSWGGSGLSNSGEKIQLIDNNSNPVDEVNCLTGWFAGKASPDYKTMERINPSLSGNLAENWTTNDGSALIGRDSQGNPIKGTPKAKNSVAGLSLTTPSP